MSVNLQSAALLMQILPDVMNIYRWAVQLRNRQVSRKRVEMCQVSTHRRGRGHRADRWAHTGGGGATEQTGEQTEEGEGSRDGCLRPSPPLRGRWRLCGVKLRTGLLHSSYKCMNWSDIKLQWPSAFLGGPNIYLLSEEKLQSGTFKYDQKTIYSFISVCYITWG